MRGPDLLELELEHEFLERKELSLFTGFATFLMLRMTVAPKTAARTMKTSSTSTLIVLESLWNNLGAAAAMSRFIENKLIDLHRTDGSRSTSISAFSPSGGKVLVSPSF